MCFMFSFELLNLECTSAKYPSPPPSPLIVPKLLAFRQPKRTSLGNQRPLANMEHGKSRSGNVSKNSLRIGTLVRGMLRESKGRTSMGPDGLTSNGDYIKGSRQRNPQIENHTEVETMVERRAEVGKERNEPTLSTSSKAGRRGKT